MKRTLDFVSGPTYDWAGTPNRFVKCNVNEYAAYKDSRLKDRLGDDKDPADYPWESKLSDHMVVFVPSQDGHRRFTMNVLNPKYAVRYLTKDPNGQRLGNTPLAINSVDAQVARMELVAMEVNDMFKVLPADTVVALQEASWAQIKILTHHFRHAKLDAQYFATRFGSFNPEIAKAYNLPFGNANVLLFGKNFKLIAQGEFLPGEDEDMGPTHFVVLRRRTKIGDEEVDIDTIYINLHAGWAFNEKLGDLLINDERFKKNKVVIMGDLNLGVRAHPNGHGKSNTGKEVVRVFQHPRFKFTLDAEIDKWGYTEYTHVTSHKNASNSCEYMLETFDHIIEMMPEEGHDGRHRLDLMTIDVENEKYLFGPCI